MSGYQEKMSAHQEKSGIYCRAMLQASLKYFWHTCSSPFIGTYRVHNQETNHD